MPNTKITAMPSLAGNQVPTDLLTAVDLSAAPVNQNVKSTLNDLFSTITKNITDRAIRFQAPGSAPAVSAASQGALYHNGTSFQASSNGGAFEQVFTLSAQTAALVFAGPATGGPAVPTFRALALTDLPNLTNSTLPPILGKLLGRVSSGTGPVEEITPGDGVLTWLQTPSSANLLAAVTDETGGGLANDGVLVFNQSPTIVTPSIANIRSGSNQTALRLTGSGANHFVEIVNATQPTGPTIQPAGTNTNIPLLIKGKGTGAVEITASAVQAVGVTSGGNTDPGILEARGGNQQDSGGKLRLYERSNNGTNYVGFEAPDSLSTDLFWTLPATDGSAGQALVTNGASLLYWAVPSLPSVFQLPSSSNPSVSANQRNFIDLSALSANRDFILPNGAVGDQIQIAITNGNATYSLIVKGASGITINNGAAATEWSRLFIANETVTFVASSTTNWQVVVDGRIPTLARMYYSGPQISIANATVTVATLNTILYSNAGGVCSVGNSRLIPRRTNKYLITAGYRWATQTADGSRMILWIENPVLAPPANVQQLEVSTLNGCITNLALATTSECIAGNYLEMRIYQNTGGALLSSNIAEIIHMEIAEILS